MGILIVMGLLSVFVPFVPVADFAWQSTGYVRPPAAVGHDTLLHGRGMWSYDHNPFDCLTEIPLWMSWQYQPDWERCTHTSPVLLVLNEPEWGGQSDLTPAQGAEFVRYAEDRWPGELWCCGNLVSHAGWLDAMLTAYQAQYGTVPWLAGVHLHVYVNDGFPVADPLSGVWLQRSQADLHRYLSVMSRWGLPAKVVVSECCLLGDYPEATYTAVMDRYIDWLRSVTEVESVAWFSARYDGWRLANLLTPAGELTAVGKRWVDWRWQRARWRHFPSTERSDSTRGARRAIHGAIGVAIVWTTHRRRCGGRYSEHNVPTIPQVGRWGSRRSAGDHAGHIPDCVGNPGGGNRPGTWSSDCWYCRNPANDDG